MTDHAALPDMGQPMPDGPEAQPPLAEIAAAPPAATRGAEDAALAALAKVALDLIKMGAEAIANWIKEWIKGATLHSSLSDAQARAGDRVVVDFYGCDDQAWITFNGEMLAQKQLGEAATRHKSSQPVRKGLNYWVLGVDNSGRGAWMIQADIWEATSKRHIARCVFEGNDLAAANLHMFTCRIEGV